MRAWVSVTVQSWSSSTNFLTFVENLKSKNLFGSLVLWFWQQHEWLLVMTTGLRMWEPKINRKIAASSRPVYFREMLINPVIIAFFDLWTMLMINKWQQHRHMKKHIPEKQNFARSRECWHCFCCQFSCWQEPESWTMAEVGRRDREKRPCPDPWQTSRMRTQRGRMFGEQTSRGVWHNYICISNWCNYNVFTLQPSGSQNTERYGLSSTPVWLLNEIIPRISF